MSSSVVFRGMRCLHQGKPSLYLSYRPCRTERDVAAAITTHKKKPIEDRTSHTRSLQKHPIKNLHDTEQTERNGTSTGLSTPPPLPPPPLLRASSNKTPYLQQRPDDGHGVGHPRGLHQNRVHHGAPVPPGLSLLHLGQHRRESPQQVPSDGAAHAPVV